MKRRQYTKVHGVHYTPPDLARFLAQVTWQHVQADSGEIRVLDPACGDGGLLRAFVQTTPASVRKRLVLVGHERDSNALSRAGQQLAVAGAGMVQLRQADFLSLEEVGFQRGDRQPDLFAPPEGSTEAKQFDVVIANPPYVRTQVLGSQRAQELAEQFGLAGRVDLYQAFVKAMAAVLRNGGTLGLLIPNRFLFVQSGAAVRRLLRRAFDLRAVFDLGDTKLFTAAVLPAIVVARKGACAEPSQCSFSRIYEDRVRGGEDASRQQYASVLDALRDRANGRLRTADGSFVLEQGLLAAEQGAEGVWSLATPESRRWIATVELHQARSFSDVARIKVGIKTTADQVFIRDDWDRLPPEHRPEPDLLHPIITHFDAVRWHLDGRQDRLKKVLYPHRVRQGKREAVPLELYPRARAYLEYHQAKLASREYIRQSGRQWYEVWVPQNPAGWAQPKVVFPDIAEYPRFFLDQSGAVVNGDCYWISLQPGQDPRWLLLLLAVANSSFILKYYDTVFHNKLYSGRRRFMTQYVKAFPLPDLSSLLGSRLVASVSEITSGRLSEEARARLEKKIDAQVWESFGLIEESPG